MLDIFLIFFIFFAICTIVECNALHLGYFLHLRKKLYKFTKNNKRCVNFPRIYTLWKDIILPKDKIAKKKAEKIFQNPLTILSDCDIMYKSLEMRENAGVAQLVEQLICNQQVRGSSPFTSSKFLLLKYDKWAHSRVAKGGRL